MSDDLLELAHSVLAQVHAGEGMEVFVSRGTDTEVRAYDGQVESLTSADSSGVGIRILLDAPDGAGSQVGFAWAGSLEPDVVAATLADARDNARFATPDPDVVLAVPDGVAPVELDLWDDSVASTPDEKKVSMAVELERAARGADPRVRQVSSADYADSRSEVALASTTGISSVRGRTTAFLSVDAIAGQGAETQTGSGFSVGRGPGSLVPDEAMDDAVRASRAHARRAEGPVRRTARWSSTPGWCRRSSASSHRRCRVRQWSRVDPSSPGGSASRWPPAPSPWWTTRPTSEPSGPPRTTVRGWRARRNVLITDGLLRHVRVRHRLGTPRRCRLHRLGGARGVRRDPLGGVPGSRPGSRATHGQQEIVASVGEGLYVQSISGVHSGVNPVSGDFSVGAEGLRITGGALGQPVREVTVASTLQRMLQSVVEIGGDLGGCRGSPPDRRWPSPTCRSAETDPGRRPPRANEAVAQLGVADAGADAVRRPSARAARTPSLPCPGDEPLPEEPFSDVLPVPTTGPCGRYRRRPWPAVGLVEPAALEHDADRSVDLAQRPAAFGTGGQGLVREALDGIEPVAARRAGIFVSRQWTPSGWHSQPESAKSIGPSWGPASADGIGPGICTRS